MRYAELHCKSNFTFLRGASHPDELVSRAIELGYAAMALTDQETLAGVVRGFGTARDADFHYIVGSEIHPVDAPAMVLWPTDRDAYGRLCQLISRGRLRCEKGESEIRWEDVVEFSEGMIAGALRADGVDGSRPELTREFLRGPFRDTFQRSAYLLCSLHMGPDDRATANRYQELALQSGVPCVASGNVHYHTAERMLLYDCVTAIRNGTTIDQVHQQRFANSQYHMRSLKEIQFLFRDLPGAVERTVEIASRCQFSLAELRYEYPEEIAPPGMSLIEHLKRLTWEGALQRWPDGVPPHVIDLLRHEMELIEELHYEAYFLTVWDMVRFARSRDILCQGRGSAANSTVCYCLGITSVDPTQNDLLFERFISRERNEAPDIDVDFEHQRREEVLQYLYEKYGRDRAGMTATVTSYRGKSAIREVGKALGLSADMIDSLSKMAGDYRGTDEKIPNGLDACGLDIESDIGQRFAYLVQNLMGFPRHLSQHVGGMVMSAGKLCELCPIENAAMEGRTVIQWDKDDLDELGILKVDVLSLGMLSAIRRCFELVRQHHGKSWSLSTIPHGDRPTYDMICKADTMGVFQIESRAQMSMLPRLRPRCFYDLVVEVAIVRPGPIQGDMVHPYLKARENPSAVRYPNDAIKQVLHKTLGVPIFQEQAMRLAVVAAGFTPGEADQLRRAMAAWRRPGVIDKFRIKLLDGMKQNGLTGKFAEQVFNQIRGFGEYGFPESHAASFALLVYVSCFLKRHYPAAFCCSLLNSQPMGFYAPAQLVADAQKHGVEVLPVDVNQSDFESSLQQTPSGRGPAIRLGLQTIRGLPNEDGQRIAAERERGGPYRDVTDITRRAKIGQSVVSLLADADALKGLVGDRRAAVWQSLGQSDDPQNAPLLDSLDEDEALPEDLVAMSPLEEVFADYNTTGMSLKAHPMSFARDELRQKRCVTAEQLPGLRDGRHVRIAGLVTIRQRPGTAKGITFVTLEDETGSMNLVIFPQVWQAFFQVAKTSNAWLVEGKLENKQGVIHIIVGRLTDLSSEVEGLRLRSRDFH
ncbi:error-prone DNA polymerase [Rhodopirellula sp. MGV]|uniref:error-prone DNA polymerase n=1 Tax=Rhodopirellula sp. MGV TaxID=2023130 RepID=UPI000B97B063|nr:error-prone DNA polymerase [Rhodopirellula sp. MGV]OYP36741.1 error-prone DNA polymerase [Rhodopirellula sp. MGV]PNY34434.1 error-prone DNA polymerase [Rhodopirellula baltica]